ISRISSLQRHRYSTRVERRRARKEFELAYNDSVPIGVAGDGDGTALLAVLVEKDAEARRSFRRHEEASAAALHPPLLAVTSVNLVRSLSLSLSLSADGGALALGSKRRTSCSSWEL
ncbi:hypothetical protein BHE74_00015839, partial [Ensete ventricosum]